jgi:hypothetical protein
MICKTSFPPAFALDTHQVLPGGSIEDISLHGVVKVIVVEVQNVAPFQLPNLLLT